MIYTFTLNPAIDYHMAFDTIELGALNRAHLNRFTVGGKGINVAIVLKRLGYEVTAGGFMGGFTGDYLNTYLQNTHALKTAFVPIEDNTRINVKLSNHQVTELNARSPYVKKDEYDAFKDTLKHLTHTDQVIISGSGIASYPQLYEEMVALCVEKNIPFALDVEKEALETLITHGPWLIKPNLFELETMLGRSLPTLKEKLSAAVALQQQGAKHVIVSLGAQGSLMVTDTHAYVAKPIDIPVRNVVGSGDSMVAGFMGTYLSTNDALESYKMAVACGTATAMNYELATKDDIEQMLSKVEIEEVML